MQTITIPSWPPVAPIGGATVGQVALRFGTAVVTGLAFVGACDEVRRGSEGRIG